MHSIHSNTGHAVNGHAVHRHSMHEDGPSRPDPARIIGYALAIALNAALLLLLMTPMELPPVPAMPDMRPVFHWIEPKPIEIAPVVEPVKKAQSEEARTITPTRAEPQQTSAPVLVENGSELTVDVPPATATEAISAVDVVSAPVPGVRLEYLQAPPPEYPRASLRMRSEGTVLLQVLVDVDGKPLRAEVQTSSGDHRLDAAAREQILRYWRFRPAMQDGHAVQAIGLVPVEFKLAR